jgi:hypothetical protein
VTDYFTTLDQPIGDWLLTAFWWFLVTEILLNGDSVVTVNLFLRPAKYRGRSITGVLMTSWSLDRD